MSILDSPRPGTAPDRGGLWAFLCERHYSVLPIKCGLLLDPKYDEFVVVLDQRAAA